MRRRDIGLEAEHVPLPTANRRGLAVAPLPPSGGPTAKQGRLQPTDLLPPDRCRHTGLWVVLLARRRRRRIVVGGDSVQVTLGGGRCSSANLNFFPPQIAALLLLPRPAPAESREEFMQHTNHHNDNTKSIN